MKSALLSGLGRDNNQLSRLVTLAFGLLILIVVVFGGYYYWDRYIHIGDTSPLELGVKELETIVRENPDDPEARVALAQYYFQNGAYEHAIEQSQQIIDTYPENDGALLILGVSYAHSGETQASVEPLQQFVAIRSESPMAGTDKTLETALYFLGESYVLLQRPAEAIKTLEQALEIDRTDADAMYQLGLAYSLNGEHELALEQYHNAVRFVPDFTEVYQGMIASYSDLDQPSYVAYARGMEAFALKDYETARVHLESAINDLPYFAPVALGLGLTLEQTGDLETAEVYLMRALELDSGSFMINNALNRVQLALNESRNQ